MALDTKTRNTLGEQLRLAVSRDHSLTNLVGKIITIARAELE